jgi:succinate-semialdehyde dehydrogenase/glutarate-semialdehyde dehydrogenase
MLEKLTDHKLFKQQAYIAGKWCEADNNDVIEVINPSNKMVIGNIPNMSEKETRRAINHAYEALDHWKSMSNKERSDILYRWHDLILMAKDDLATIIVLEQGKTITEARKEIAYSTSFIKYFSEEAKRTYGKIIPSPVKNQKIMVTSEPVGVVGIITPWNFPSSMIIRKISAAFAAGCTVVVKPSDLTPYSALALGELSSRAGIPDGVLNIVTGEASVIAQELTSNKIVKKISFTGSTRVGKLLMSQAASNIQRLSLELGGNAPFIVFDDADLDLSLECLMAGKFRNNGQSCISPNRIYLQKIIYEKFIDKLKDAISKIKLGDCFDPESNIGPLINQNSIDKIMSLLRDALSKGAKIISGGNYIGERGYFFQPTILVGANHQMEIANTEIFGPLIAIYEFETEDQVIKMANDTDYGLASYIFSKDYARIYRVSDGLEYGMVGINEAIISNEIGPFGGIKQSGFGREGSYLGMNEYLNIKYKCWNIQ